MADYWFAKPLKAIGPQQKIAKVRFTTASTSDPTVNKSRGVVSVTRSGVGVFVVTLAASGKDYHVTLGEESTAALSANRAVVTAKSLTSRTITVTVCTDGWVYD